jgi:ABC-type transport system involved in multi-copper enzyme maturation permease subunit
MFEKIFRREWKDKLDLLIFACAGILLHILAFLLLPGKKDLLDILTGAMTVIFLPFIGLLLGAGGFAAEFKDDAWAYLFSRPVRRSTVWLAKYAALLTILAAVLLVFSAAVRVVPGLSGTVADLGIEDLGGGLSLMSLGFLLSWVLLTIGFSLSFLTERQYAVVFSGLLIWAAFEFGLFRFWMPLLASHVGYPMSPDVLFSFTILIPAALALASLWAFVRTDFSQPARKARDFAKFAAPLLIAALILGTIWTTAGVSRERGRRIFVLEVHDASVYFESAGKIFRFDAEDGRLRTIARARTFGGISVGGGKLAFNKQVVRSGRSVSVDLWMMNTDGSGAAPLAVTSREDSPFRGAYPRLASLSPDGGRVAFAAKDPQKRPARWLLGSVRVDGTGLEAFPLDIDEASWAWIRIVGWSPDGRGLLVYLFPDGRAVRETAAVPRLVRFDLETGSSELLAENTYFIHPIFNLSASQQFIAFVSRSEADRRLLVLMDITSRERQEVVRADSIEWYRWTDDGSRLAFLAGKRRLGVYSPAEKRVIMSREFENFDPGRLGPALTWVRGGAGLALKEIRDGAGYLVELGGDLSEKRAVPFPFDVNEAEYLVGIGASVLVLNSDKDQLWLADLDTGAWRKVY